jgi:hypothetical protein
MSEAVTRVIPGTFLTGVSGQRCPIQRQPLEIPQGEIEMLEQLHSQLAARGVQGRVVSVDHLGDLEVAIEEPRDQGLLDAELVQTYLAEFDYDLPETLPDASSIIVVAIPQPQVRVTFT